MKRVDINSFFVLSMVFLQQSAGNMVEKVPDESIPNGHYGRHIREREDNGYSFVKVTVRETPHVPETNSHWWVKQEATLKDLYTEMCKDERCEIGYFKNPSSAGYLGSVEFRDTKVHDVLSRKSWLPCQPRHLTFVPQSAFPKVQNGQKIKDDPWYSLSAGQKRNQMRKDGYIVVKFLYLHSGKLQVHSEWFCSEDATVQDLYHEMHKEGVIGRIGRMLGQHRMVLFNYEDPRPVKAVLPKSGYLGFKPPPERMPTGGSSRWKRLRNWRRVSEDEEYPEGAGFLL